MSNFLKRTKRASEEIDYDKIHGVEKTLVEHGYDPNAIAEKGKEIANNHFLKEILKDLVSAQYREMGIDWCTKMIDRINNLK